MIWFLFISILALLLAILGIIGSIVPALPGVLFSFLAVLAVSFLPSSATSGATLILVAVLSIVITILDFYLPAALARGFGGTKAGQKGAVAGMIIGMVFFSWIGIILGPPVGAYFGEVMAQGEKKDRSVALRSAIGSFLAFIVGTGIKLGMSIYALIVVVKDIYLSSNIDI